MKRRDFTKTSLLACCGIIVGGTLTSSCSPYPRLAVQSKNNRLKISKEAFLNSQNVVVDYSKSKPPLFLTKTENTYSAVLMECTHVQCALNAKKELLLCPCHGSQFTFDGDVIKGPAKEPLQSFDINEDDAFLYVIIK